MDKDGVPYITKFAQKKARHVLKLAHSIQLTENLFVQRTSDNSDEGFDTDIDDDDNSNPDEATMVCTMYAGVSVLYLSLCVL